MEELPFYGLEDDSLTTVLLDSNRTLDFPTNLDELCFNVFDLNDDNNGIDLASNNDPDSNFELYRSVTANCTLNSNYYLEDAFSNY